MNKHEISDVIGNAKMEFKMMMAKERKKFIDTIERVFDPHHFHQMVFGFVLISHDTLLSFFVKLVLSLQKPPT